MTDSKAPKTYMINEIFYSLQGEGMRAGTANVFVRFSGCNMRCDIEPGPKSPGNFACDTEFASGVHMTLEEIEAAASKLVEPVVDGASMVRGHRPWQVLTGGEPGLQVDERYCQFMRERGWKLAIETNGSVELPRVRGREDEADPTLSFYCGGASGGGMLDWITVSPKVAEHAIRQKVAHEVKYVRGPNQGIPKPVCKAEYQLISPAFNGMQLEPDALAHCIHLVKRHPEWRLSVQAHKAWRVR